MKVKVACLFAGVVTCWHQWFTTWDSMLPMNHHGFQYCAKCNASRTLNGDNPDPLHDDGDYWRLVKGMMSDKEKWRHFLPYARSVWAEDPNQDLFSWLLLDPARFIDLIWQWTGLEVVQDKWGWEECHEYVQCTISDGEDGNLDWCKNYDAGECDCEPFGKLPAPWLTARKEAALSCP